MSEEKVDTAVSNTELPPVIAGGTDHLTGLNGLAGRAIQAAMVARATDPGFARRRENWQLWQQRTAIARQVAVAFDTPVAAIVVIDDPDRRYGWTVRSIRARWSCSPIRSPARNGGSFPPAPRL